MKTRTGFSFIEILIGVVILVVGLIPLMIAYTVSTRDSRVSMSQVQAINHATNLLEALRAFGQSEFKNLLHFPRAMEQRRGGANEWTVSADLSDMSDADEIGRRPLGFLGEGLPGRQESGGQESGGHPTEARPMDIAGLAEKNFAEFKRVFFSPRNPVVPHIDDRFKRAFKILVREQGYVTLIVKVSWDDVDPTSTKGAQERTIELRTVLADPYLFISQVPPHPEGEPDHSPGLGEPRTDPRSGSSEGAAGARRSNGPGLPPIRGAR